MPATTPATLAVLQALQSEILANSATTFAALSTADAARYGVARAVFVGVPKEFKDALMPQCHIIPIAQHLAVAGVHGRITDVITLRLRVVVDYSDWWAAEQQVLAIRDLLVPVVLTHLRAGATAGGALVALASLPGHEVGAFATLTVATVTYRTWELPLTLTQSYVPASGLSG